MTHRWDPDRYLAFADERGRPFVDLLARVGAAAPRTVVDLGCGPGNLTTLLADRWPDAHVVGLDSSPEMIEAASGSRIDFEVADLRDWAPTRRARARSTCSSPTRRCSGSPSHLDLLPRLVEQVAPGGWFAFQVPGNFDEPSHTIRAELAAESPTASTRRDARVPPATTPPTTSPPCRARLHRRRLGDDVPPPAHRRRPGLHLGVRHQRPARPGGAARRPARGVRRRVQARLRAAYPERPSGRPALPPHLRRRPSVPS